MGTSNQWANQLPFGLGATDRRTIVTKPSETPVMPIGVVTPRGETGQGTKQYAVHHTKPLVPLESHPAWPPLGEPEAGTKHRVVHHTKLLVPLLPPAAPSTVFPPLYSVVVIVLARGKPGEGT